MFKTESSTAKEIEGKIKLKVIPGFSNYGATTDGKIWSYLTEQFLIPNLGTHGYYDVSLWKNKERYRRLVHRLVLETFIGPCPVGMECRHLDGNKQNNELKNLCWGTRSSNRQDAINHGTFYTPFAYNHVKGEQHGYSKLKEYNVRMIIYTYKTGLFTHQEIADIYDVCRETITAIINKKTWKHIWVK